MDESDSANPSQYDAPQGSARDQAFDATKADLKRAKELEADG